MFSLEQLNVFVTTVETGSFSAAARKLGKVQSAVSQQIINMEVDCNKALFDRTGRYPVLTHAGEAILQQAKAVITQHQRLNLQIAALDSCDPVKFTLAIDEGVPYAGLTKQLHTFTELYPLIQLELLTATSPEIIKLVKDKRADMGIVFSEEVYPQQLDFESLGAVAFDPFVSAGHPLAKTTAAHLDMLKLHRQLVIGAKDSLHGGYKTAFSPDVWYADNYYVLLELAKSGFGWTLLPSHIAQDALSQGTLHILPTNVEQFGWLVNVDVVQHIEVSDNLSRLLRKLLREMMDQQAVTHPSIKQPSSV
ncbi:LysR family transcriptional regulator [Shewanella colwelliana]|uniref:LysR family transcriptional regulator n=1 Tax=Shewanella colwelliana TaxID=23 RepID=UPI003735D15B